MSDVAQKLISGNDIKNGCSVSWNNSVIGTSDLTQCRSTGLTLSVLENGLTNRFDEVGYYHNKVKIGDILSFDPILYLSADYGVYQDAAIQFNAADKSHLAGTRPTLTDADWEIGGWFYADTVSGTQFLAGVNTSASITNSAFRLDLSGASCRLTVFQGTATSADVVDASVTISADTWYFVRAWHDAVNDKIKIQVNNGTITEAAFSGGTNAGAVDFTLGATSNDALHFDGRLDSWYFRDAISTDSEATTLYNSGIGLLYDDLPSSITANLERWHDLGESVGDRYDSHGTNHLSQQFDNIIDDSTLNGGFETVSGGGGGTIYSENFDDGSADGLTISDCNISDYNPHSGSYSLQLSTRQSPYVTKTVNIGSGGGTVSFWEREENDFGGTGYFKVNGSTKLSVAAGSGGSWTFRSYSLDPGSNTLRWEWPSDDDGDGQDYWYIDDIEITESDPLDFANWTATTSGSSAIADETSDVHAGSHALRMDVDASNSSASVTQPILLTSGKLYSYSYYAKSSLTGTRVRSGDGGSVENYQALTDVYAQYSHTTRGGGTGNFVFLRVDASESIYLDSVTLQAAEILPAPGIARGQAQDANFSTSLNGTNQYFNITTSAFDPGDGDFSYCGAFYVKEIDGDAHCVFSAGSLATGNDGVALIYNGIGAMVVYYQVNDGSGATSYSTGLRVEPGNWYTFVVNYDRDDKVSIYINNTLWVAGDISTRPGSLEFGNFYVGRLSYAANYYWDSLLDNIGYANRLLTNVERTWLHNNGEWRQWAELGQAGTDGENLTADIVKGFWEFDDASALGTDSTSNGNDLTPQNSPTQAAGINYYAGQVSYWMDRSGSGNHASQTTLAKRPSYISAGQNGKPVLSFDGVDDFLALTSALSVNASDYTIFFVYSPTNMSGTLEYLLGASEQHICHLTNTSGKVGLYNDGAFIDVANAVSGYQVLAYSLNSTDTSGQLFRNGIQIGSDFAYVADDFPSPTHLMANNAGTGYFTEGEIAEIVVYPRALSETQRKAVEYIFKNKWGIS